MFQILVCTQDACKRQMAEKVLERFKMLVQKNGLTNTVRVSPSPCLGLCNKEGVTIQMGSSLFTGVTPDNTDYVFTEYVLDLFSSQEQAAG